VFLFLTLYWRQPAVVGQACGILVYFVVCVVKVRETVVGQGFLSLLWGWLRRYSIAACGLPFDNRILTNTAPAPTSTQSNGASASIVVKNRRRSPHGRHVVAMDAGHSPIVLFQGTRSRKSSRTVRIQPFIRFCRRGILRRRMYSDEEIGQYPGSTCGSSEEEKIRLVRSPSYRESPRLWRIGRSSPIQQWTENGNGSCSKRLWIFVTKNPTEA